MSQNNSLKDQRDRFLAFSFASADLFIEIDSEGQVAYMLGAAKALIGADDRELMGKHWLELFEEQDRPILKGLYQCAKPGQRCGPLIVTTNSALGRSQKAMMTGIKMPEKQRFYLTLGVSSVLMAKLSEALEDSYSDTLIDREVFPDAVQSAMNKARELGKDVDLTLLDFSPTYEDQKRMGKENWNSLRESVHHLLKSSAVDGEAAAEIADGRYSVLHDKMFDSETLRQQIEFISQENDPTGKGVEVRSKTVTADLDTLSEREAARALVYTINEFERKGADLTIDKLNTSFDAYLAANTQKVKEFKSFIDRLSFFLHFQPIVDLKTMEASHYEMLCRFDHGNTQEWVIFGEDIGMAPDFDLAVCERAINYIHYKAGGTNAKFALNISGQSIQNKDFVNKLMKQLGEHKYLHKRLMFEITESAHINDLDEVNDVLITLQKAGYKVALDDFGAGSASFQYLQNLNVDYVKIDGQYIRNLKRSERDRAMVKNLSRMCRDLNIKAVAEFVEDEDIVDILRGMGVHYGQGYYFGKPKTKPDYKKPKN